MASANENIRAFVRDYTLAQSEMWATEPENVASKHGEFYEKWMVDEDVFFVRPSGNPMGKKVAAGNHESDARTKHLIET